MTCKITSPLPLPAEFVAVTVKVCGERTSVGVPWITQVDGFISSPSGRSGEMEQFVMEAPLELRVVGATDMDTPNDPVVPVEPEKLTRGTEGEMLRVTAELDVPIAFVAVMLKVVEVTSKGAPEITQVCG
jgi:hypothetical protein